MVDPLWTAAAIARATGGHASAPFDATGVTFDSREVTPGDLFVALTGAATDGHRFAAQALAAGAAGVLANERVEGAHVLVADTAVALDALARAARARGDARVIGVTGSVGKTSIKEALFAALDRATPGTAHRSLKSYNNHVGVPLSLSRMPATAAFGVFEMGMNHPGELAALTRLVRPHVALVTAIAPAHAEFFADEAAIADAKGEIFQGLEAPDGVASGTAIIPYDSPHRDRLAAAARPHARRIVSFGLDAGADVRPLEMMRTRAGTFVTARVGPRELSFTVGQPGRHWVSNALAVLAAVDAVGGDLALAGLALADLAGLAGRGARLTITVPGGEVLVIDESYNANPSSMRATLAVLADEPGRHVAVLGEMRELGDAGPEYHAALAEPLLAARVDTAMLVGPGMTPLADALAGRMRCAHVADGAMALAQLSAMIEPGDAVLIKGSNGIGLSRVVAGLQSLLVGGTT